jgi:hypothetical protein
MVLIRALVAARNRERSMTTVTRRETEVAVAVVRGSTRGGMRRGIGVIRMIIEIRTEARKGVIGRGVGVAAGIEIPGVRLGGIDVSQRYGRVGENLYE